MDNIIGENVILRPITYDDTEDIIRWRNDPDVKKNFVFQENLTMEIHRHWLDSKVFTGEVLQYIIQDKRGRSLGSVYFRDISETNKSAEYGIFIGEKSARGNGLGTEVAKIFVSYGFDRLGLHRVFLRVFEDNIMAIKSYLNAGFEIEGLFKDMIKVGGGTEAWCLWLESTKHNKTDRYAYLHAVTESGVMV